MRSRKHWIALGLLAAFGVLIVINSKKPAERVDPSSLPPVEHDQMAVVAAYVVSASDVCLRANAPQANAVDAESLPALRDACTRATEEQARALNGDEGELDVEDTPSDTGPPVRKPRVRSPRVARRAPPGAAEDSIAGRKR
jgi:hypothetical protein